MRGALRADSFPRRRRIAPQGKCLGACQGWQASAEGREPRRGFSVMSDGAPPRARKLPTASASQY